MDRKVQIPCITTVWQAGTPGSKIPRKYTDVRILTGLKGRISINFIFCVFTTEGGFDGKGHCKSQKKVSVRFSNVFLWD